MRWIIIISLLSVVMTGCGAKQLYVPDFSKEIDYSYCEIIYMGSTKDKNNIVDYKYYNDKKQLIEQVGHEYRCKFTYNSAGKLAEIWNCRMYNCKVGWKEILKYDSLGNYIGKINVTDTLTNLDTVRIDTVKFYDSSNFCIKELSDRGNDAYGNYYECWKYNTYSDGRIISDTEIRYQGKVWAGVYSYDEKGNLISINRTCKNLYEKETFEYDSKGKLIKETIESNEYPVDNNTIFSVKNNWTKYEYDGEGRQIKKLVYNHKGVLTNTFTSFYENKKN